MTTSARQPLAVNRDETISAYGPARATVKGAPLSPDELRRIDAYWQASLYLCLGMLYLRDNPLLREPLKLEHIKPRLLGHWGSDPGQATPARHQGPVRERGGPVQAGAPHRAPPRDDRP